MDENRDRYLGVDVQGLAISGVWEVDSPAREGETLVKITGRAARGWTWDGTTWIEPIMTLEWTRKKRDKLLAKCDWVVLRQQEQTERGNPRTFSQVKYEEWLDYREALRQVTDTYVPTKNSVFPVEPM